jgi:hypothetical protein
VARTPPEIRRALAAVDAEAAALLTRYRRQHKLPAWLAYYRGPKPEGGEAFDIVWARGRRLAAVRRGYLPKFRGRLPLLSAIIDDPARLDPAARHIMRLWLATAARQKADRANVALARRVEKHLRDNLPSLDRRSANLVARNLTRQAALAPLKKRVRAEAERIKAEAPGARKVAERVKAMFGLKQSDRTIRRWLVAK